MCSFEVNAVGYVGRRRSIMAGVTNRYRLGCTHPARQLVRQAIHLSSFASGFAVNKRAETGPFSQCCRLDRSWTTPILPPSRSVARIITALVTMIEYC